MNAKLLLLGDGPLQDKMRQKVDSLGLTESVVFAGLQKDPAPFYSAMDVFAFPSLWEGLPLTLVEAQYSGVPCVVSENVTKEVLISEHCVLVKELDLNLWAKSLESTFATDRKSFIYSTNFDINNSFGHLKMLYEGM